MNYDAGAEILHHYQLQWNELHELAEENAQKAQEADGLISTVHAKLEQEWTNVTNLNNMLVIIPKINNSIQHLMDQIGIFAKLKVSFFLPFYFIKKIFIFSILLYLFRFGFN